jgi:ubiquinone/menaquinone biosynthesis C-methylase UbiE
VNPNSPRLTISMPPSLAPRRHRLPRQRSRDVKANLAYWERISGWYEKRFSRVLRGSNAMAWGTWRVPESQLRILGKVRGKTILDLGCGAARWSKGLAALGARPVGLDLSPSRLRQANRNARKTRLRSPLIRGDAEQTPFRNTSVDIVISDFGAMSFCDPYRTVPEVARILKENGILAFATWSPLRTLAFDERHDRIQRRLVRPYFGMHRCASKEDVEFQLPYGEWIRLFRDSGLTVENLIELPTPSGQRTPYLTRPEVRWGERWPLEAIWKVRKRGSE